MTPVTVPGQPAAMRNLGWMILVVAIWLAATHRQAGPEPLGADAPAASFSGQRAKATLARVLGPQRPHPVGSAEDEAVRGRITTALSQMGVASQSITRFSCYSRMRGNVIPCGTVTNLVADILPGQGPALVLAAHLDSVPAGPGAGDDGIGVATLLETIRALRAAPPPSSSQKAARHPVIALFTDGEEAGMLGAAAMARDPAFRARIGMMINVDARGNEGQSLLYQTSGGDAALIDLYARSVARPATSSLYAEIYKVLPNDTDMTPFLEAGVSGYNFANIGHVAAYHTPIDDLAGMDARTLQSHGDSVLALTRVLAGADFATLKSGNAVYADVLNLWLPRLPLAWALPLALAVLLVLLLVAWGRPRHGDGVIAILAPPVFVMTCAAAAFVLQWIAAHIAGEPDPAYARPLLLRLALALAVFALALAAARRASLSCAWLWFAGAAVGLAWFMPGASPYFLFPALVASVTLPFAARLPWLAFVPAVAGLLFWIPLTANVEALLGLAAAPVLALVLAIGSIPLLPLLKPQPVLPAAVLALIAAIAAGLVPTFDAAHPQRLNVLAVEQDGRASWIASPVARLPASLRAPADFSATPQPGIERGYVAPRGPALSPPPNARALRQGRAVTLDLDGAGPLSVFAPKAFAMTSLTVNGVTVGAPPGGVMIGCVTPDCAHLHMILRQEKQAPETLLVMERHVWAFPDRPPLTVPSQMGDQQIMVRRVPVP